VGVEGVFMNIDIFHSLLDNVALLFLLSVIYEINILRHSNRKRQWDYIVKGGMIGLIGIIIMSFPFTLESGLIFDTRSILIGSAALVFSTPSIIIASVILIIYRIILGGIGMWTGILVVTFTAAIGILWKKYVLPKMAVPRWLCVLLFGFTIHVIMILCFFAMPLNNALTAIRELGGLILILYPIATMLISSVLFVQKDRESDRAKLAYTEEKYRNLFNNHHTIMMIIDPDNGNIVDVNPATESFYGWTRSEMIKMNLSQINTLSSSEIENRMRLVLENKSNRFEHIHRRADGSVTDVEVFSGPIQIEGRPYLYSIITDVSDKKKLESATRDMELKIHQQQRLESIGTLAGGVAHEINNPINGIMNFAQLIKEDSVDNNDIQLYSDMIIKESERISNIVRNLLQFSRYDKVHHSFSNVDDIIYNTISLVNVTFKKDQINIQLKIADDVPKIRCRSQQIQQVFMNLLTNARDAINEKYPDFDEDKKIEVHVYPTMIDKKEWVAISVKDHGNGIHPSIINRIYEPFFSTKPKDKGTGLGLSISFGIVKDHHGRIEVESEAGVYTLFKVLLPVDPQEVTYV
jgi:PAS domain S-box-containing protein